MAKRRVLGESSADRGSFYKRASHLIALHKQAKETLRNGDGIGLARLLKEENFSSISQIENELLNVFEEMREAVGPAFSEQNDVTCTKCFGLGFRPEVEYLRDEGFVTQHVHFARCECQLTERSSRLQSHDAGS